MILIAKQSLQESPFQLFAFLDPFSVNLWGCIVAVLIFYGFIHAILEVLEIKYGHNNLTTGSEEYNLTFTTFVNSIYDSMAGFSGIEGGGSANSISTQMLRFTFFWFIFIIISSYTAQLTSFIVVVTTATSSVQDINDANQRSLPICIATKSQTIQNLVIQAYPAIQMILIDDLSGSFLVEALNNDQCKGVLMYRHEWDLIKDSSISNPNCDLLPVGGIIRSYSGSWAFNLDYDKYCTSLMNVALSSIILNMQNDGTFERIYQENLNIYSDKQCDVSILVQDSTQLDFKGMVSKISYRSLQS